MQATKAQISKIHVLLNQLGCLEDKPELVKHYSAGRVTSTKELTMAEASALLKNLSRYDPLDGMRRKVFALAYDAKIIYGSSQLDKKLNGVKLDSFLMERGTVKKQLSKMNKEELQKTVNQFTQIAKHKEESEAGKITQSFFAEMGITTETNKRSNAY